MNFKISIKIPFNLLSLGSQILTIDNTIYKILLVSSVAI